MKKHLKFIEGTSDKFWQIEVNGTEYTVTYGRNGTDGVAQTKTFATAEECLKTAEKLLAEKIHKGYSEDGSVTVSTSGTKTEKSSSLQDAIAAYDAIIKEKRIHDLLPFLQEKTKGHVAGIKKHIKQARRYWTGFVELPNATSANQRWGYRGDETQKNIIVLSAIGLFDKTEITSWDEVAHALRYANDPLLLNILQWAQPPWLDTFLLEKIKKNEWINTDYRVLRLLEDQQLIQYNPELFALALCRHLEFDYFTKITRKTRDHIQWLVTDPVAYQRDIPTLFQYETSLHLQGFKDSPEQPHNTFLLWEIVFRQLLEAQKLDRGFFIENCLQIQTKDWNNNLKAFFRKRLEELAPSTDELMDHQETIFTFLHAPFPPIVNSGVEYIKQMMDHPKFDGQSFIGWLAPLMMRTDCKGAIKTVMPMLEKLTKSTPALRQETALLVADVLVIADMTLQERAVKCLQKIAPEQDAGLSEKLAMYAPFLLGNIKASLGHFLGNTEQPDAPTPESEHYHYTPQQVDLLQEAVVLPGSWNDILFQFGQFISSEEMLDAEIMLHIFLTQRQLFPPDYDEQLKPYQGQLERQFFEATPKNYIKDFLLAKILHLDRAVVLHHYSMDSRTLQLIKVLVEKVQDRILRRIELPLLSMPTHKPYWIAPKTLLERIIDHQHAGETIDLLDLSIAISRMPRQKVAEAIPLLERIGPDWKPLLEYCLGVTTTMGNVDQSIFSKLANFMGASTRATDNRALWAVAGRTHYPQASFPVFEKSPWQHVPFVAEPFKPNITLIEQRNEWINYRTKEKEQSAPWVEMRMTLPAAQNIPNHLLYSLDLYHRKSEWEYTLFYAENVQSWHSLMPQNPEPLAVYLIKSGCTRASGAASELLGFLSITQRPEWWFSDITTLVFACCFFQEKKEVRMTAQEVLIQHIQQQSIPISLLGEKTAWLISGKYGAMSRFADSLAAVKDVSALHNAALLQLLDTIFKHLLLPEKAPVNFKKLVEHYVDILTKTQQKPAPETIRFFNAWKDNAALKPLVKQILAA